MTLLLVISKDYLQIDLHLLMPGFSLGILSTSKAAVVGPTPTPSQLSISLG